MLHNFYKKPSESNVCECPHGDIEHRVDFILKTF